MLSPKRTKFRKQQRGRLRGRTIQKKHLVFGEFGLQAQEPVWLTARQIEATRRTITRYTKRGGKLWIMVFPDKPITARAEESRMGSGKGAPQYWVAVVKPGKVLFELSGVPDNVAQQALRMASYKLPIRTKLISAKEIT
ncbi:ribosomal protein L16 (chloroplast) [Nannochloropsis oceanica]|uniref:Large ribosomal subunit protein uL16c n=1 Tax=Nannochloropsis oceanica TaxID=145522 RepID=T1RIK9_9STRA|nr:ribosomal protein L16 [Nannochloropsis oceanica]AGI98886.1 ribosomal protein L16 [Nannochloropsis oceanica]AGI99385.1 ribosomal protein L16 [Nannochloropsis oceanica]AHX25296.1 50S ribosomal protein L16 [Nannochloropsis oceanica]